jgi:uncharacterized membrane protein
MRMGWDIFNKRALFFVGLTLIYLIVSGLISGLSSALGASFGKDAAAGGVSFLVSYPLSTLLAMGLLAFTLKAYDSIDTVKVADLWHPQSFLNYVGASILVTLIIILGYILLIVPGVIASLALMFATYLVIDHDLGPVEALKESVRITQGNRWNLFVLGLALVGINILGFLCLIVGLLVSLPVSGLALVHAYRFLSQANAISPASNISVPAAPTV